MPLKGGGVMCCKTSAAIVARERSQSDILLVIGANTIHTSKTPASSLCIQNISHEYKM